MSFAPAFTTNRPRTISSPSSAAFAFTAPMTPAFAIPTAIPTPINRTVTAPRSFTGSSAYSASFGPSFITSSNSTAFTSISHSISNSNGTATTSFGASTPINIPAAVPAYSRFLPQSFFNRSTANGAPNQTAGGATVAWTNSGSNNALANTGSNGNYSNSSGSNSGSAISSGSNNVANLNANAGGNTSPVMKHVPGAGVVDGSNGAHVAKESQNTPAPLVPRTHTANAAINVHKVSQKNETEHQQQKYTTKLGVLFPARSPDNPSDVNQMIRHYRVIRSIGEGAFGKVKLALDTRTNVEVAVKTYAKAKLTAVDLSRIYKEIDALRKTNGNKNVIKMMDSFEERDNIYIILEFAQGGDLLDYLDARTTLSEVEAKGFFYQIAKGLHHCHTHKIIHRDLKLENILLNEDQTAKITDFGLSNQPIGESLRTICGTPVYRSPEMVNNQEYTFATDVWSLGVILYALLHGRFPFYDENLAVLFKKITTGRFPPISNGGTEVQQLIHMMLHVNPKARITLEGILNHPWLRDLVSADPTPAPTKPYQTRPSIYSESSYSKDKPTAFCPVFKPRSVSESARYQPLTNQVSFSYGTTTRDWNPVPASVYSQRPSYVPAVNYLPPR